MKDAGVGVENQRQKMPVSFPHRQEMQMSNGVPGERPFLIFGEGCAEETVDAEDKAQPLFPVRTKAGPVDGPAQQDFHAVDPCFLLDFPGEAGKNIFVRPHFAAQAVVLAKVSVGRPGVAMDQQGLGPVRRKNVAKGSDDGSVGHVRPFSGKSEQGETIRVSFELRREPMPQEVRTGAVCPHLLP